MFYSIMFPTKEQHDRQVTREVPAYFHDLNLDKIIDAALETKERFELNNIFYSPVEDKEIITYRQDILREIEEKDLRKTMGDFSKTVHEIYSGLSEIRRELSSYDPSLNNHLARGRLFDGAERYCGEVSLLTEKLSSFQPCSTGLRNLLDYLKEYCSSPGFMRLASDTKRLREAFSKVSYCMVLQKNTIQIRKDEKVTSLAGQIAVCFDKFRTGEIANYKQDVSEEPLASHIEAATLQLLSKQYKPLFSELESFCAEHFRFEDRIISMFSREIQFYLSWLDFIEPVKQAGLPFCLPSLSDTIDGVFCSDGFDLALARLIKNDIVTNNFALRSPERIIVVTGPNQGGKTTFARAFGQLHYLAALGLSVPGNEATVFLFDNIFTHFGREEDLSALEGKLKDDLIRLRTVLDQASDRSIVIINEIFTSTVIDDALVLGRFMIQSLVSTGTPAVIITFLDELAVFGSETVSMMSAVLESDPVIRTFKITRKPPDGLAYAGHIAGKHSLTYEQICERLK